jgi:methionyl-tRNA formyltransferase
MGVTVLQAVEEMDAGPIWAEAVFPMRQASKASLYRREVTNAAVTAVLVAIERFQSGAFRPEALNYANADVRGRLRPLMGQSPRRIDWEHDATATVIKKSMPLTVRPAFWIASADRIIICTAFTLKAGYGVADPAILLSGVTARCTVRLSTAPYGSAI